MGPGLKKKGSLCRCVSVSLGAVCFNLGGPTSSREGPRGALGDPIRPDPGCLNLGGPPPLPGRPTEGLPIDFDLISTLIRPSRPDPGCLNLGGPSPGVCVCVSRRGVFQPWGTDLLPGRPTGAPSDRTAHGGPLRPDVRCVAPRRASAQTDLCGGVREKMSHRKPVLFGGKPPSILKGGLPSSILKAAKFCWRAGGRLLFDVSSYRQCPSWFEPKQVIHVSENPKPFWQARNPLADELPHQPNLRVDICRNIQTRLSFIPTRLALPRRRSGRVILELASHLSRTEGQLL